MVVKFVESWGAETCRVSSAESEVAWCIHQCSLGCQVIFERLMMRQSQSEGSREVFQELHLVLGIGREGIDMLVDITRGCRQIIFSPVSTKDGRRVLHQSENGLHLSVHHPLLFRLHIVAHMIGLCLDVVLLTIAETIDGEGGLQGVLGSELIDTSHIPAEAFVAHFVV